MAARAPAQQQLSPIKEGGHDKSELEGLRADKEGESKRESKPRGRAMFPFASSLLQCLLMRVRLFFSFFKPGRDMSVGERRLKVVRLLAEGGFSFVYLVENAATGERHALKKVLAAEADQVKETKWEIEVHSAFSHPHLMPLIDHCNVRTPAGTTEFRLLMPLYGLSLQDRIMALLDGGRSMEEADILAVFAAVCEGVRQFHEHSPPWAHRDIKPANVLLGADDSPVLMDFGSTQLARVTIESRTAALLLQEDAAQHCSMAYRAPELWDVPSACEIDERTDVWSLGCTLYAMAFYFSPFECTIGEDGVPRVCDCSYLRVIGGLQFPRSTPYSAPFLELIKWMLTVDKDRRPFVHEVEARIREMRASRGAGARARKPAKVVAAPPPADRPVDIPASPRGAATDGEGAAAKLSSPGGGAAHRASAHGGDWSAA